MKKTLYAWMNEYDLFTVSNAKPPNDVSEYVLVDDNFDFDHFEYAVRDGKLESVKIPTFFSELSDIEKVQKRLDAVVERNEFLEDCLAELIQQVYSN